MGVFIAVAFLGGCKKHRQSEPPGPRVRKVELEGVQRFEDEELHEYLNLQPTPAVAFGAVSYYLPGLEDVDARRIEDVYASYGYYDARVTDAHVRVKRSDRAVTRQRAYVTFTVDEGAPTRVEAVDYAWSGTRVSKEERRRIEAASELRSGDEFGTATVQDAVAAMRLELMRLGFARAEVEHHTWVDREAKIAKVRFELDPGDRYRIARIDIEGLEHVPEYLVRREVESLLGKTYSPDRLTRLEQTVYAMEVFGTVGVENGEVMGPGEMAVVVRVNESKLQRLKVGVGLGIDPVRWEQHASLRYRHDSLFGHLTRLSLGVKAGYAELPALYDPEQHGPIAALDLEMRKKGLLERNLVWTAGPRAELGIWEGYQFYSVGHRIGVSRFFTRYFELGLSYNNRFTDFFNVTDALDQNRTILGLAFRDPYVLAYLQTIATVHLTDDIVDPHNGVRLSTTYDLASTYLGGQFDYHKVEPDLRAYWRPHDRVQLAARGRVGFILPFGRNPAAPIDLKWYLGGSNDVRGWPFRRLSPRVEVCDDAGENCDQVPVGGNTMVHGTAELRVRAVADLWLATFGDMGDVREGVADFAASGLMYSTGGGLRYYSPVGALRLDVGVRLNDDERFPEPRIWAIHFGLGETF